MTLVIVTIILLSYILIATEKFTNISKAAVAIFVGTLVWILYVGYGMDFVTSLILQNTPIFWLYALLPRLR